VIRLENGFALLVPEDLSEEFATRLSRFILRAKVKVRIDDSQLIVGLINRLTPVGKLTRIAAIIGSPIIRMNDTQQIILCTPEQIESQWSKLKSQLSVCDEEDWHLETIRNGHVNICNATKEQFIPQMIQLEKVGGVSFTKG
jgi:folate-binding Fe-S cluster repair protein YgfZ